MAPIARSRPATLPRLTKPNNLSYPCSIGKCRPPPIFTIFERKPGPLLLPQPVVCPKTAQQYMALFSKSVPSSDGRKSVFFPREGG